MLVDAREAMRASELGEAEFMYRMFECADPDTREALGMAQLRLGGGEVTVMARDPTGGLWSRAIGLGVTEPVTHELVDEVVDFVRYHGGRSVVFQVAPSADPSTWPDLLAAAGTAPGGVWVKLAGDAGDRDAPPTDLRTGVVGPERAEEFARVMCAGFEMPLDSALPGWFAGLPSWREAGFTTYGAWEGTQLVATASLFVHDGVGTLSGAATLPSHRGRGAQTALMVRRIRDAAARGCRWITGETGAESAEARNPSLHNMRRLGLVELYERRNWVWRS